MKALVLAAVLAVLPIAYPAAAHVSDRCSAEEIAQTREEKREAAQEFRRAVQRQDPAAIYQRFIHFIQADARQSTALDRWVECVNGRNDQEETMKRIIPSAIAGAAILAPAAPASAHSRDAIMERVVWPCVAHEVQELDLQEHHSGSAAIIMFELDRDFYEEVIDAVQDALRERPDDNEDWVYEAGLAACIQNQGSWSEEPPQ